MAAVSRRPLAAFSFDPDHGRLGVRGGAEVDLTVREVELLVYLDRHHPRPVPEDELLRNVWGYAPRVRSRAVHAAVVRLRRKLAPLGIEIVRHRGRGLELSVSPEATAHAPDATGAGHAVAAGAGGPEAERGVAAELRAWLDGFAGGEGTKAERRAPGRLVAFRTWMADVLATEARRGLAAASVLGTHVPRFVVDVAARAAGIDPAVVDALARDGWFDIRGEGDDALWGVHPRVREALAPVDPDLVRAVAEACVELLAPRLYVLGDDGLTERLVPAMRPHLLMLCTPDASDAVLDVLAAVLDPAAWPPAVAESVADRPTLAGVLARHALGRPPQIAGTPGSVPYFASLVYRGLHASEEGRFVNARRDFEHLLHVANAVGHRYFQRLAHSHLARLERECGDAAAAMAHHAAAEEIARSAGDTMTVAQEALSRAATWFELGRVDETLGDVVGGVRDPRLWATSAAAGLVHIAAADPQRGKLVADVVAARIPVLAKVLEPAERATLARGLAREVRACAAICERRCREAARLFLGAAEVLEPLRPDHAQALASLARVVGGETLGGPERHRLSAYLAKDPPLARVVAAHRVLSPSAAAVAAGTADQTSRSTSSG
ncbi:MAG: winged helix family transcriptional regulator [Deltaproteobacteria bacterium]|nr:MAG: winged helix family transcriptional regulator [Deltaproteobacteria bacterium]